MINLFAKQPHTDQVLDSSFLSNYLPQHSRRYQHILGVVRQMKELLPQLSIPNDWKPLLIQACYLHDIGYSPKLNQYDYHPLDGAIFAAEQHFPKPVISAILFHSCAYEALFEEKNPNVQSIYQKHLPLLDKQDHLFIDLVTYCDLHTSPTGETITFQKRLEDIFQRYGMEHPISQVMIKNQKKLNNTIERVRQLIHSK